MSPHTISNRRGIFFNLCSKLWILLSFTIFFFAPKFYTDTILNIWVTTCRGIVQYANRYTKTFQGVPGNSLLDSFLQNHNLVCCFTRQTMVQFHQTAILISSLQWLELAAEVLLDSCWVLATREDCLNQKPFSISANFFCHSSEDFFNFLLLHSTPWLTVEDYFPCNLYPFIAYFYMQRYHEDLYMPLKLWESFLVTRYNWLFTLWWAEVPKEIIFGKKFCKKLPWVSILISTKLFVGNCS